MAITTSIVINFVDPTGAGAAGGSYLSAEIDSREDGYNAGRTQFIPGDSPVFLVYKTSDVSIQSVECTSGSAAQIGTGTIAMDQFLTFADSAEASLSLPPVGPVTLTVLAGSISVSHAGGTKVVAQAKGLAVVRAQYNAPFIAYRLSGVPASLGGLTTFPVVVFITGSTAGVAP